MRNPACSLVVFVCAAVLVLACGEPPAADRTAASPPPPERVGERLSEILALDAPLPRAAELAGLLAQLDPEALPAVREAIDQASIDRGDTELVLFATWWAGFDPEAAHAWATREWTAAHASVFTAIFRIWAARDPEAAWEEAAQLLSPMQREIALDAVIVGWYQAGGEGLESFIEELPPGELKQRAAEALARQQTVEVGARGALEWVEGLPAGPFRELLEPRVAGAVALAEPAVAAEWATPRIDDSFRGTGLARRVATRWVISDPEAAMAWLATLPAGGDRKDGVLEAYRDWLHFSRDEAITWIEGQEVEPWLEPALGLYARGTLAPRDPVAALALAARITDARWRDTTATYIARGWLERDYQAADAWLQQSDLPPDVVKRAYMIRAKRRPPGAQPRSDSGSDAESVSGSGSAAGDASI